MRFAPEKKDGANAGLDKVQKILEPIKDKYKELSYADLWILSSYVAIEDMGGPNIPFRPGRKDATSES
jgi:catalase (peroxidase I)